MYNNSKVQRKILTQEGKTKVTSREEVEKKWLNYFILVCRRSEKLKVKKSKSRWCRSSVKRPNNHIIIRR